MSFLETFYMSVMVLLTLPSMAGSIYMGFHVDYLDARREKLEKVTPYGWTSAKVKRVLTRLERETILTHILGFACLGLFGVGIVNCTEFYFVYIK